MSNNSVMQAESLVSALHDALELERMLVNSLHKSTSIEEKQSIEEPTSSLHHVYPKRNCSIKYVGVEEKKSVQEINKALHNPLQSEYRIRKVEPNTFCFEHKKKRRNSTHAKRLRAQFVNNIAHERSLQELIRKVNATERIDSRQQQHEQQQKLKSSSSCTFIPFPHPHNNCVWGDKSSVCVKQQEEEDKNKCQHLQRKLQPMPRQQESEEIQDIANTERFNNYESIPNSHVIDKVANPIYNNCKQSSESEKEHPSRTKSFPTQKISAVSPSEHYNTNAYATSGEENKLCSMKVELESTTQLESNDNNIASNYLSHSVKRSADTLTKWRSMRRKMAMHRYNTTLTHDYKTVQILLKKQEKHRNSRQYALLSPALEINEKNEKSEIEEESKLYNTENDIDETVDISSLSESSVESEHSSEYIDKMHLGKKETEGTHETNNVETYGKAHDRYKMNSNATTHSSSVHSNYKQISPTKSIMVCDNNIKTNTFSDKGRASKSEKTSVLSPPTALKELSCASSNISSITTTAAPSTAILLNSTLSDEVDREENSAGGDSIKLSEKEASKEANKPIQPLDQSAIIATHTKVNNCKDNVHDAYIEQQKRRAMCFAGSRQVEQENVEKMKGQLIKPLKLTRATFDERVETINELDAMTHKLIEQMIKVLLLQNEQKSNSSNHTHHCNTSNMLNSTLINLNNNNTYAKTKCQEQVLLLCRQNNIDYVDLTFPPVLSSLGVHHLHTSYSSLTHFTNNLSHTSTEQINGKVATPFALLWCPLSLYDQISKDNNKESIAESDKSSAKKVTCSSPELLIHPCAIRVGRLSDYGVAAALAALAESPSSLTHILQLDKWCADQEWQLCEDSINSTDETTSSRINNSIGRNIQSKERDLEINHNKKENKRKSIDCKELEKLKKREEEQEDVELQLPKTQNTSFTNKMSTSVNSSIHICYVWLCINGVWDQVGIDLFLPCVISDAFKRQSTTMEKEMNNRKSCKEGNDDRISNTSCNLFYGCSVKAEFVENIICQASSNASIDILLAKYWPCFIEKALAKVHSSTYLHRQVCHQVNIDLVSSDNNDIYDSIIKKQHTSCINSITANNHSLCDSYQQLCNLHAAEVIAMLTGGPIEHWDEWWKHDSSLAFDEMESVTYEDTGKGKGILLLTTNKYLPSSYTDDTLWIKLLRPETTYRVLSIAQCEQTGEIVAALRIWHQQEECHSPFDTNFPLAKPVISSHKERRVNIDNENLVNQCRMSNDAHFISERNIDTTVHVTFDTNNNENSRTNKLKDNYNNNSFKNEIQDRSSVIEFNYSTQILPYFSSCHVCYDCRHFNDIRLPIEFVKSAEHFDQTHATSSSASTYATPSHIIRIEIGENVHDKRTEECVKKGGNDEINGISSNRRAHLWIGLYQPFMKLNDVNCRHEELKKSSSLESSLPELMSNNKSRISTIKGNREHSIVEMKLSLVEDTKQGMHQMSAEHNATENSCARASIIDDSKDVSVEHTEEGKYKKERECQASVCEANNNSCSSSSECQFYKHHKRYCLLGESFGGAFRAWPSIWLDVEVDWSIPRVIYIIPQLRWSTGNDADMLDDMSKYHDEPMIYNDDDEDDAVNSSAMPSMMEFTSYTDDDHRYSKNSVTNAATYTKLVVDDDNIGDDNDNNRINKSSHIWCSTVALLTEQPKHFHITELHSPDELTAAIQHNLLTEVDYHHSESPGRKQRKFNKHTR